MKALILAAAILAGLGFAACRSTPTPETSVPRPPETREATRTPSSAPPEKSKSGQSATQPPSETSRTPPAGAGEPSEQTPAESSRTRPAESPDAPEPGAPAAAQKSEKRPSAASPTAEAKLQKARDDLRVSRATERKIAAELERLKKSGSASAEDIRNYEIYHERVQAMVAENRRTVEKMERALSRHKPGAGASDAPAGGGLPQSSQTTIPEEQTEDPVAALDRRLTASLSEFDAMLLKEMEAIETQSAAKMHDLAQEAAEAAKRLKEKGVDLGTAESESSDEALPQDPADETAASAEENGREAQQGEVDETVAAGDRPEGQGPGPKSDRGSRYSKEDDDIVARQLREAAEKETDPELKEKLWKEYEDYKKNTQ